MKGDFSRFTFDPTKHYARVLTQQGRVQLDSDWNDQVAMLLHRLETMAADLIGPFGGPARNCGFDIVAAEHGDFGISKGRYYVGGLLCENDDATTTYTTQPLGPEHGVNFEAAADYLVYLDAWEQYVNAIEDPDIREKALGGPDTSGRSQVVWRVRTLPLAQIGKLDNADPNCATIRDNWNSITPFWQAPHRGLLNVKAEQSETEDDSPCIVPPSAHFRGLENQLYRIEIHSGGKAAAVASKKPGKGDVAPPPATFKWSRENGSVIFPVALAQGKTIGLEPLGGHSTLALKTDDWVELIDDDSTVQAQPDALLQVKSVDSVKLDVFVKSDVRASDSGKHAYLRRWDQKSGPENKGGLTLHGGAAILVEGTWLNVEDGIQIQFEHAPKDDNVYRAGDYWYIPARTADEGRISWPGPVPPDGVNHRYAPLAILTFKADGQFFQKGKCVSIFNPQTRIPVV
jgi:hypothetical protein